MEKLGRYRIRSHLARGGMGDVYLAAASGPDGVEKPVAIKLIRDNVLRDRRAVEMFVEEAKVAFLLTHPNVVQTYELGQVDGHYLLVMEYVPGLSLEQLIDLSVRRLGQPVPTAFALYIASRVARGLAYAHDLSDERGRALKIVHRDVSPGNILLSFDGQVKLADFGLVKSDLRRGQSQVGTIKGKLAYMPPEQLRGEPVDARADIYALGVVLYELLSGGNPFLERTEAALLQSRFSEDRLPPLAERAPHVEPPIPALVDRCVAALPAHRVQAARELGRELDGCARELGLVVSDYDLADFVSRTRELVADDQLGRGTRDADPFDRALGLELQRIGGDERLGTFVARSTPAALPDDVAALSQTAPDDLPRSAAPPGRQARVAVLALVAVAGAMILLAWPRSPTPDAVTKPPASIQPTPSSAAQRDQPGQPGQLGRDAALVRADAAPRTDAGSTPPTAEARKVAAPRPPRGNERRPRGASRGTLSVNTTPWSVVYIDGRRVRSTPLLAHPLRAGRHIVRLVNPARQIGATREIVIAPGEELRLSLDLTRGSER